MSINGAYKCRFADDTKNYTLMNNNLTKCYKATIYGNQGVSIYKTFNIGDAYNKKLICTKNGFAKNKNIVQDNGNCLNGFRKVNGGNNKYYICVPNGGKVCKNKNLEYYAVRDSNFKYSEKLTEKSCKKNNYKMYNVSSIGDNDLDYKVNISRYCNNNLYGVIKLSSDFVCRQKYSKYTGKPTLMSSDLSYCYFEMNLNEFSLIHSTKYRVDHNIELLRGLHKMFIGEEFNGHRCTNNGVMNVVIGNGGNYNLKKLNETSKCKIGKLYNIGNAKLDNNINRNYAGDASNKKIEDYDFLRAFGGNIRFICTEKTQSITGEILNIKDFCKKGEKSISGICISDKDSYCDKNDGTKYKKSSKYVITVKGIYNKKATELKCKENGDKLIKYTFNNISSICNDNQISYNRGYVANELISVGSSYKTVKFDLGNNFICRLNKKGKFTIMSGNGKKCYTKSYKLHDYKMTPYDKGVNIETSENYLKYLTELKQINLGKKYKGEICTKNGFVNSNELECSSLEIKTEGQCVKKTDYICMTQTGRFKILSEKKCIDDGGKLILASKSKNQKNDNINSSCNDNYMQGIGKLGKKFKCRINKSTYIDSKGEEKEVSVMGLINSSGTKCIKQTVKSDGINVKIINKEISIGEKEGYSLCTSKGFISLTHHNISCKDGFKKIIVDNGDGAFSDSYAACVPSSMTTCKNAYNSNSERIWSSTKNTILGCDEAGGFLVTPTQNKNCNDKKFNGEDIELGLKCRKPIDGGIETLMNEDQTECKYGNNWYIVGETFDIPDVGCQTNVKDGCKVGQREYFKCTIDGLLKSDEDKFIDEADEENKKLKTYANNLCKDGEGAGEGDKKGNNESGIYGIDLPSQYVCKVPEGTNYYTLVASDKSCINLDKEDLLELKGNEEIIDIKEKIYEKNNKISEVKKILEEDFLDESVQVKNELKIKKLEADIDKLKEKEGYAVLGEIRGKMQSVKLGGKIENKKGIKMTCTDAGFFTKKSDNNITEPIQSMGTKGSPDGKAYLQYLLDDNCGGKFILYRERNGGIIKKMEIKASCENKDEISFSEQIGYECNEWGGDGIYDWYILLKKGKKQSCDVELGDDATYEEKEEAAKTKLSCEENQNEKIINWQNNILECLGNNTGGIKKGYGDEPKRKKQCYLDNVYPFGQEIFNYAAICKTKYGNFNGDLIKIIE